MSKPRPDDPCEATLTEPELLDVATAIRRRSVESWGAERAVTIVGQSEAIREPLERLVKVARFHEPVLILGESGVGKESFAQALHVMRPRAPQSFVSVNCPQYQEGNLTVSELFGHSRGSFTGATNDRRGCFETADGGSIFLDEVADLHMSAQVMLLRSLATGEFQPLGSARTRRVNVRVISATNRDLNALAADERFRRDLLFRLRYFQLEVPPLRARGEDWKLLAKHFLSRLARRYGVVKCFSADSVRLLDSYAWPGNVRELVSVTTAGYALSDGDRIEPRDIVDHLEQGSRPAGSEVDEIYRRLCR